MSGSSKNERMLAMRVRELSLTMIEKALTDYSDDNKKFRQDLLLKLATSILPRKNELTGEDGGPIQLEGVEISVRK